MVFSVCNVTVQNIEAYLGNCHFCAGLSFLIISKVALQLVLIPSVECHVTIDIAESSFLKLQHALWDKLCIDTVSKLSKTSSSHYGLCGEKKKKEVF